MEEENVSLNPSAQQTQAHEKNDEAVNAPELGFMELLRAPADDNADASEPDATDRVLSRRRPSAWDF